MEEKLKKKDGAPLGVILKNPLNIRRSKSKWMGAIDDGNKGKFVRFQSFYYGWRAAIIIMTKTYYNRGWNTPAEIISHWAPFTENDTRVYLGFVCNYAELRQNEVMPPLKLGVAKWRQMLIAMARIEIGYRWVTDAVIKELDDALTDYVQIS